MNDMLRAAAIDKAERRGWLLRALAGLPEPEPDPTAAEDEQTPAVSFDGGARPDPNWSIKPSPTHGEFVMAVIEASRGAGDAFAW